MELSFKQHLRPNLRVYTQSFTSIHAVLAARHKTHHTQTKMEPGHRPRSGIDVWRWNCSRSPDRSCVNTGFHLCSFLPAISNLKGIQPHGRHILRPCWMPKSWLKLRHRSHRRPLKSPKVGEPGGCSSHSCTEPSNLPSCVAYHEGSEGRLSPSIQYKYTLMGEILVQWTSQRKL